jgi:hypothetical protein
LFRFLQNKKEAKLKSHVLKHGSNFFKVAIGTRIESVSVDRLKLHAGGAPVVASPPRVAASLLYSISSSCFSMDTKLGGPLLQLIIAFVL